MRPPLVAAVAVVLAFPLVGAGCFGRANPRIQKMVREQGGQRTTTQFRYDDSGHPSEVSVDFGGVTETLTLTFDGGQLVKLDNKHQAGGGATVDKTKLEYDGGRLVKASTDVGNSDQTVTTTVDYDDSGRVSQVERTNDFGDGAAVDTTTFDYGDNGLESFTTKSTFSTAGQGGATSKVTTDITYKDGRIDKLDSDNGESTQTARASYVDGVLDTVEVEGQNGRSAKASYDYEGGRIVGVTQSGDNAEDINFAIDYDDGDAADLDMAPNDVTLGGLWDLRGAAFNGFDAHSQAARLAGVSW